MHRFLSLFAAATFMIFPAAVFANGMHPPGEEHLPEHQQRREGGVNPVVVGGLVVAAAGAIGFFVFTRAKKPKSPQ